MDFDLDSDTNIGIEALNSDFSYGMEEERVNNNKTLNTLTDKIDE